MSTLVRDVPGPAKATARSLKITHDRIGGDYREKGARFLALLEAAVHERQIDLSDVSLEEVAKLSMGEGWKRHLLEGRARGAILLESGQPVTSDFFAAITGQYVYSEIRKSFDLPAFVFSQLVPTQRSEIPGTETVPEIAPMGDVSEDVLEGAEYPSVGIGSATYTLPASRKRGMKIEITEETLSFSSSTGLTADIMRQAGAIGQFLGYRKELSLIDVIIGFVNNYIRNGSGTNTYLTAGAYVNNQTSAELVDYTDIDSAEQLLNEMLHPDTGLPIMRLSQSRTLIVSPAREMRANAIVDAIGIRTGDITTGTGLQTQSGNPLAKFPIRVVSSPLMIRRILQVMEAEAAKANDGWFWGDLAAFIWKELWPLTVAQQGADSNAGFERDVVMRWKARYHGVAAVKEPRLITRNENSAWAL